VNYLDMDFEIAGVTANHVALTTLDRFPTRTFCFGLFTLSIAFDASLHIAVVPLASKLIQLQINLAPVALLSVGHCSY
jgi:hypothetical protein